MLGRGSKEEGIQRLEIVAMKKEGKKNILLDPCDINKIFHG